MGTNGAIRVIGITGGRQAATGYRQLAWSILGTFFQDVKNGRR